MLPQHALHRDERYWDEPETFQPERWDGLVSSPIEKPSTSAYFPFGDGSRICVGCIIAIVELHIILGTLLRQYRFELESQPALDLAVIGPTTFPTNAVKMRVVER